MGKSARAAEYDPTLSEFWVRSDNHTGTCDFRLKLQLDSYRLFFFFVLFLFFVSFFAVSWELGWMASAHEMVSSHFSSHDFAGAPEEIWMSVGVGTGIAVRLDTFNKTRHAAWGTRR